MVTKNNPLTRRRFMGNTALALAAAAAVPKAFAADSGVTGADVVKRIREHLDMKWDETTYRDTLKGGDLSTPVKGIAVCFMSTFDVIQRANAAGLNFVLSHEPTYWSDGDKTQPIENDHLYLKKKRFIEENKMIVFRLHDHWHRMKPEPMTEGFEKALGWTTNGQGVRPRVYHVPPTTLGDLGVHMAKSLHSGSIRLVGNPAMHVETVCFGSHALSGNIAALQVANVAFPPEAREWDSIEYARDLSELMPDKGMAVIAHEAGEEAGFLNFPEWLKPLFPEIPVQRVATNDRMWLA